MTTQEARAVFEAAEKKATNPDDLARTQLLKEYFTNPTFRKHVEDMVYRLTAQEA